MLWNEEQWMTADQKEGADVHHYVYDYTGERLLKGKVSYYSMWQDDEWLSSSFVLDAYTVYINPYAVVQNMDYDGNSIQWITNHYYTGTQRLASGMAVRQYTSRPGAVGDESSPVLDELEQHLAHFGFEEGKDYARSSFEQPYQLTMQFPQASNKQEGSTEERGNTLSNPLGVCTGIYSDLYWYHPNYLGNVDLVTDLYGNVHQGFLYTPWGENMHEHHATTSGFNSPFRFNAKELDETGLAYYGARYYQNRYSLWLSVDPLANEFPHLTSYNFTENNPINLHDPNGMSAEPPTEGNFDVGYIHTDSDGSWRMNEDKKWEPLGDTPWQENYTTPVVDVVAEKTDHQRAMENPLVRKIHGATGNAAEVIMELALWVAPVPKVGPALKLLKNVRILRAAKGVTNLIPEGKLANHLFKGAGKLADTPANRTLIQKISNGKPLGVDQYGKAWYTGVDAAGKPIYSYTQNGVVKGAGYMNMTPAEMITKYGLK